MDEDQLCDNLVSRQRRDTKRTFKCILLVIGWILICSELSFFILFFINLGRIYHNHLDEVAALNDLSDVILCGYHFLGTFISLSQLMSRLNYNITHDIVCDKEPWSPTWWLVSLVCVCVDLSGYIRTQLAHTSSLVVANMLGNLINSCLVFVWSLVVTINLFCQYMFKKQRF